MKEIMLQPVGESEEGANFAKFAAEVAEEVSPSFSAIVEFAKLVASALNDVPANFMKDRKLLKGSIMTAVRTALHLALVDKDTRDAWKSALCAVTGQPVAAGVPEQYLQLFCRLLKDLAMQFIVECVRTTAVDAHSSKRSTVPADNYDSLFSRQTLHQVLGAAVRSLLKRCRQYSKNKNYQQYESVTLENMTVITPDVYNPLSDSYWTQLINRKGLLFFFK